MKLSLLSTFEGLDGKPLIEIAETKDAAGLIVPAVHLTVQSILKTVCTVDVKEDGEGSPQDIIKKKMLNFELFLRARENQIIELTTEEIVHLKERVAKVCNILVMGPLLKMLEGKDPYNRPQAATVHEISATPFTTSK